MKDIDIDAVAKAIEEDAGELIPDLRQALKEAKSGVERITTPEHPVLNELYAFRPLWPWGANRKKSVDMVFRGKYILLNAWVDPRAYLPRPA